jgi:hypothetical protein
MAYRLMRPHCHRLVWRGEFPNPSPIVHGPSQRTGSFTLHRSMGIHDLKFRGLGVRLDSNLNRHHVSGKEKTRTASSAVRATRFAYK